MRRLLCWLAVVWLGFGGAKAEDLVIEALDADGNLTFNTISNAQSYRIEWAPADGSSWTNFQGAAEMLDEIAASSDPTITVEVPFRYRVVATVTNPPFVSPNMVLIPAGSFLMGTDTNVFPLEAGGDERPQHSVNVSAFYMDQYEVTKALWDEVKAHNGGNGYTYSNMGVGKATNHPVQTVNWFDVVKWCNARSQRDGLMPVYYTDAGFTTLYKTGETSNVFANWAANGYRLPTEAEWEKAARGGAANTRFPWTDFTNRISWAKANYYGLSNIYGYDLSGGSGAYHPTFATGGFPYTSPAGYFAPNGYGLYDMAGNVVEWCWDWYDPEYYANSPGTDPRGPTASPYSARLLRGGNWLENVSATRVATRGGLPPDGLFGPVGFRCARGL